MKISHLIHRALTAFVLILCFLSAAPAMDDPGFSISRMVISEGIDNKEPVGVAELFPAGVEKVYCFLEAREIENDTTVNFVWYFEDKEVAKVPLPLQRGLRWRTFSSKKIARRTGNWKVELQESSGIVLNTVFFQVQ